MAVGRAQGHGEAGCTACTRWLPGIPLRPARRWRQRGREWRLSVLGTRHCRSSRGLSPGQPGTERSEEHTSELQSLMRISYAVFCLKKKTKNTYKTVVDQQSTEEA